MASTAIVVASVSADVEAVLGTLVDIDGLGSGVDVGEMDGDKWCNSASRDKCGRGSRGGNT